jgi:hypothetical protein
MKTVITGSYKAIFGAGAIGAGGGPKQIVSAPQHWKFTHVGCVFEFSICSHIILKNRPDSYPRSPKVMDPNGSGTQVRSINEKAVCASISELWGGVGWG